MTRAGSCPALAWALAAAVALAGCAATPPTPVEVIEPKPGAHTAIHAHPIEPALADRVLALDPDHVTAEDVANVLSKVPAPRIMLMHGGIYPVHLAMSSFGTFLVGMGYPEAKIRDPGNGDWSYSPYTMPSRLAGIVVWQYEQDAMRPMLIGHSQGGLYAVKVLKELAGTYQASLPVWNPVTDRPEARDAIVDPYTGAVRPAIGVSASYASAVGAGGLALVLPNQWDDFANLRKIPDTVDEFTGYFILLDLIAMSFPGNPLDVPYEATGTAKVRNVTLPAGYNHVFVPVTHYLLDDPKLRKWIDDYQPGRAAAQDDPPEAAGGNLLWAADVWHSVKRHWVLEAQRLVRAQRSLPAGG
ncbi:MAG TPA: hypothetical protein PLM09_07305 [Casimicrobiaceae bacterium]|nr:hypothetical protein [Casimicrobiaceae bacterium]